MLPYLSALENTLVFKGTLQMSTFTLLLKLYFSVVQELPCNNNIKHAKLILNSKRQDVTALKIVFLCHYFQKIQKHYCNKTTIIPLTAFSFV